MIELNEIYSTKYKKEENAENKAFKTEQIITYIGNKRKLLANIETIVREITSKTDKDITCADLFSGSGVVARMLKQYSSRLIVNDLEKYSEVINSCYLTNAHVFDIKKYDYYKSMVDSQISKGLVEGIISKNYAPADIGNITPNERVFYTPRNAKYIDTVRKCIDDIEPEYRKFFLAPLLYEASVHTNTSGLFKAFYKDTKTKVGRYGGTGDNCLSRITSDIKLQKPVFSNFDADIEIYRENTNELIKEIKNIDIAYLDPPYNQHPYGANYFMLNTIVENKLGKNPSKISGIPCDWNRSDYNKKAKILDTFEELIYNLDAHYIVISYNSEGFMAKEDIERILNKYGKVETIIINYNAYRGSRNLKNRNLYVNEYLFVLEK